MAYYNFLEALQQQLFGGDTNYDWIVQAWWISMVIVSAFNCRYMTKRLLKTRLSYFSIKEKEDNCKTENPTTLQKERLRKEYSYLSTAYAFVYIWVCGFRALFPRQDVEKYAMFDFPMLSSVVLGRSLATIAEICFIWQVHLFLDACRQQRPDISKITWRNTNYTFETNIQMLKCVISRFNDVSMYIVCGFVYLAEICSWIGVTTRIELFNGVEESIWCFVFILVGFILAELNWYKENSVNWSKDCSYNKARILIKLFMIGNLFFITFMLTVDIPMYLNNWMSGANLNDNVGGVLDGFYDSLTCKKITASYEDWEPHLVWMWLYFVPITWFSIMLTHMEGGLETECETRKSK